MSSASTAPAPSGLPTVLALQRFPAPIEQALSQRFRTLWLPAADGQPAFADDQAGAVRAIATGGIKGASRQLMERLPGLEIVAINGVGTDAVDLDYTRQRQVRVTNTPSVLTDDVADLAIGLLLATARQICEGDRFIRALRWTTTAPGLATKVSGKRLGIVGLGRIGRAIAHRAEAFGMAVAYHNPRPATDVAYRYEARLEQLARDSDFLVLAAPGGPKTHGLIDRAIIEALGPEGILINIARGNIVDEAALVAALQDGRLGGAGLDVFAAEPHVPAALLGMANVVLSPHRASATVETRQAMGEMMLHNLTAHFAGEEPPGIVR